MGRAPAASTNVVVVAEQPTPTKAVNARDRVAQIYLSQVGVMELTGHNDGPQVQAYLASTGLSGDYPWCVAFVSWVFQQAGIKACRSAYSPDWFKTNVIYKRGTTKDVHFPRASVGGIYFESMGRIAHGFFIDQDKDGKVTTVEGNSNNSGGRDGLGVFKRIRLKSQIYAVSDWIKE